MLPLAPHPEDIKAALRKRFGSTHAFERARGLPHRSVADVLRGRPVTTTALAIADELGKSVQELFPGRFKSSAIADDSTADSPAQHLNSGANQ